MSGNEPASKSDIAALDHKIDLLRSETSHQYNDMVERLADSETRILNAI
jgi:hypothetical protein